MPLSKVNKIIEADFGKLFRFYGKYSFLIKKQEDAQRLLGLSIPRRCVYKVFKESAWQGTDIEVASIIQNIFWINGLAPRVLGLFYIEQSGHTFPVQLTEYLEEESPDMELWRARKAKGENELIVKMEEVARVNYIEFFKSEKCDEIVYNWRNWLGNKYVDFGGFQIDLEKYKARLIEKINNVTHFGHSYEGHNASYQSIPDWKVDGKRKTDYRIKTIGLDDFNFIGKSVVDIGCNLGMMLRYAKQKGAVKLTGYDFPKMIGVAKEFANFNKDFDINLNEKDLSKSSPKERADIVFYLAMSEYLGFPKWLSEITKEVCFYEGHANEDYKKTEFELKKLFREVLYLGNSKDRSIRPLFRCYK